MSTWEDLILKKNKWKDKTIEVKRAYTRLMYRNQNLTEALAAIIKCMEDGYGLMKDFKQLVTTAIIFHQYTEVSKEIDDTIEKMINGVNSEMTHEQLKEMKLKYVNTNNPYLVNIDW